jgi:hypothetical protein
MKEMLGKQNSTTFVRQVFSASVLYASASYCQRALVDESGIMIKQLETHNSSEMVAV